MTQESNDHVDQREPWQKNPEFNNKLIVLISFGFFTTSVWSIYNNQVPLVLEELFENLFIVGFILTLDNIVGVIIQPLTGSLSDRTKSRFGRRMPFVMIGLPISALFFFLLGITRHDPVLYILVILGFITSMAFWRAPIVALMPDFVHPKDRSKGNAIVNVLGGIGTVLLTQFGSMIIDINYALTFGIIALVMIGSFTILFVGVKEPDTRNWDFDEQIGEEKVKKPGLKDNLKFIWAEEDKSMVWMMLAIFFWFIAYDTSSSFISLYAQEFFDFSRGAALQIVTFSGAAFLLFAPLSVYLSKKLGRKKTILIGLIIWAIGFLMGTTVVGAEYSLILYLTGVLMGIGWSFININSIIMVWSMAPNEKATGVYTGLYYTASFSSQIVGPLSFGFIFEYGIGIRYMLLMMTFVIALAFISMAKVKRGEYELSEEEKEHRKQLAAEMDD